MLIPSIAMAMRGVSPSLSRRVNANSQPNMQLSSGEVKLIKKGEC